MVTSPAIRQDPLARSRFLREARALATVRHPNVVTVFDVDEQAEFLTMEIFEGSDLSELLRGPRRLAPTWVMHLADQVAAGLDAAHAKGLVHRDVSPANIVLEGRTTFPSCAASLAEPVDGSVTQVYMSPEQVRHEPATCASDIYAFGCVLFHCLAGRPPITRATSRHLAEAHQAGPGSDVRRFAPALPEAVQDVLDGCLAAQAQDRFRTAGAVAAALRSALTPRQNPAVRERLPPPPATGRTSRALLTGCAAVVLAAGVTGGVAGSGRSTRRWTASLR